MASANFTNLTDFLAKASVNFSSGTFKALLVSVAPSEANLDAWVNRSDVTNECSGAGYSTGGAAVTATVGSVDTTNNRLSVTYSNPSWSTATLSAVGAIVYLSTGVAANDKLLHWVDFGATVVSTAGTFAVTFSAPFYINR